MLNTEGEAHVRSGQCGEDGFWQKAHIRIRTSGEKKAADFSNFAHFQPVANTRTNPSPVFGFTISV